MTSVAIKVQFSWGLCVMPLICCYCVLQQKDSRKWYIYICSDLAKEYNIAFNQNKTASLPFGNRPISPDVYLYRNGEKREWTDNFKHLGYVMNTYQEDDSDIQLKCGHFYRSVNGLCCKFKSVLLNSDVATRLFQTYCCSFHGIKKMKFVHLKFWEYLHSLEQICVKNF